MTGQELASNITVAMTPSFLMEGDNLLRAQLRCLSEQEFKDFDVLLVDSHYQKRKGYMPELAEKYKLNLVHVPYTPNLRIAKRLDCAIFNAPYCYSESPKIVRYSCWRFVKPHFTKICAESKTSVDFYFHNVEPPTRDRMHPVTNHDAGVWPMTGDTVNWDLIPTRAGKPGASWGSDSDRDAKPTVFPLNCYGNYMVPREEWMRLNGCDEAIFSSEHWEDQDFCRRAHTAGIPAWRKAHAMYRMHHLYGGFGGRANILPDYGELRKICPKCEAVEYTQRPDRRELKRRMANGDLLTFNQGMVWVCKDCLYCGPVFHADEGEYAEKLRKREITRSNILPSVLIGRNLRILAADMDGKSLPEKVEIFNDSYSNPKYYQI